jgi:hypothetical protein
MFLFFDCLVLVFIYFLFYFIFSFVISVPSVFTSVFVGCVQIYCSIVDVFVSAVLIHPFKFLPLFSLFISIFPFHLPSLLLFFCFFSYSHLFIVQEVYNLFP